MHKTAKQNQVLLTLIAILAAVLVLVILAAVSITTSDEPEPTETTSASTAATENVTTPPVTTEDPGPDLSLYPPKLVELLTKNPETEKFVLEYFTAKDKEYVIDVSNYGRDTVPLFLQWDQRWGYIQYGTDVAGLTACGPTCLAMVGYYLTGDPYYSPDKMMQFATQNGYCTPGGGTPWILFSQGGVQLGFKVTELPLDKNRIRINLQAGVPIVCSMGPGIFTTTGHYIVLTGWEDGKIRINDPNSIANSEKLWTYEEIKSQIRNLWAFQVPQS